MSNKIKVLVINEPFVKDFCRTQRWAARTRGRVLRAPDWLAYATAVLERNNLNVKLIDMVAEDKTKEDLRKLIIKEMPDFVVLDSTTPSIYSDIECASIIKEVNKDIKIIMVGPHISALPDETLKEANGAIDVACIGEYDYTVKDVIENFSNLENVKGICYISNGKIIRTPKRPLIEELDNLPFPAWHHLDLMKYFDGGKLYPYIDIISGRGCPNLCIFCLWPQVMHGTYYRMRSPKNVVDEIEYDLKLCPKIKKGEFFFEDDTFTVNKKRAIEICEEILRRNLKITFSVNARVDTADLEMFKIMKRAGCRELLVGFESGVNEILEKSNKKIRVEQSYEFIRLAKEAKLAVHGCFVIGLLYETEDTAKETIKFALSLGCDTVQFSGAVPFPGTVFYEIAKKNNWLNTSNWRDWLDGGEQKGVISYKDLNSKIINYYVDLGLKKFYFRPGYIIKFLFSTKNFNDLYRKLRGAKNFLSYLLKNKKN